MSGTFVVLDLLNERDYLKHQVEELRAVRAALEKSVLDLADENRKLEKALSRCRKNFSERRQMRPSQQG